jgi:hypothetical protein
MEEIMEKELSLDWNLYVTSLLLLSPRGTRIFLYHIFYGAPFETNRMGEAS